MIYVAKSYQGLEFACDPYQKNNRSYIKVKTKSGSEKEVRVYTEAEYLKMYPEAKIDKPAGYVVREILGFGQTGSVCLARGDEGWLERSPCRFHVQLGWYYDASFGIIDEPVPDAIEIVKLEWDAVGNADGTLKSKEEVVKAVKKCWESLS